MRQKNKRLRVDSAEVQGIGSFVIIKSPSWGLLRKAQRLTDEGKDAAAVSIEFVDELICESVLAWNWTDDDDQPLPAPAQDKTVVDRLTAEEVAFLVDKVTGLIGDGSGN